MKCLTALSVLLVIIMAQLGCVKRSLEINSTPQGAMVYLNDEEVGRTPTTVEFTFYGTYDVRLEKEGYVTLNTSEKIKQPLTELPGPDLIVEVLPWTTYYKFQWQFEMEKEKPVSEEGLVDRGNQLRALLNKPKDKMPKD